MTERQWLHDDPYPPIRFRYYGYRPRGLRRWFMRFLGWKA